MVQSGEIFCAYPFVLFVWRRNEEAFVEQISGDSASDNAEDAPRNDAGFRR